MTDALVDVFMIDPPWPKRKGGIRAVRPNQERSFDYQTMSVKECFALLDDKILSLATKNHNVFLWTIDQFLRDAEGEMEERLYKRHARIVWDKTNGVAPAFTVRYTHEYLIWFYKIKLPPISSSCRGKFTTIIRESSRQHSRKPDAAYEIVSSLYPDAKKLDVFSREPRAGWVQWGDQVNHFTRG